MPTDQTDPHKEQPVHRLGPSLESAAGAVIMLHGRGASADDILNLAQAMYHPKLAYLAPPPPATPGTQNHSSPRARKMSPGSPPL